jgi:ATP/maltotriose-dependent transcriptional regulator MalT
MPMRGPWRCGARSATDDGRATALRHRSLALKNLCRGGDAVAAARLAVHTLEPLGTTTELAAAYSTLARVLMMRGDKSAAIDLARRAHEIAGQVDATDVVADALNTEGCASSTTDERWTEPVRRSLELALSHNLQSEAGRAFTNLYGVLCDQHRYREAEQYFVDGIAYCDEHDLDTHTFCLLAARTDELEHAGRWDEAVALCTQLLSKSTTAPLNRIAPSMRLGLIRARRGGPGIWEPLDEASTAADPTGEPQHIVPVRLARAEAHLLEGRPDDARREAELAADWAFELDPWMRGELMAWLRRTRSDRALDGAVAAPFDLELQGRHTEAAQAWDELGCSFDAGMVLLDSSDEAPVREALRRFDALGATASARLARQALRRLGVRSIPSGPRRKTRAHPLGMTPREWQVLELICARRTNAEIAQELFISAKTVDHHVSAVLAKLAVDNRGSAAEAVARLGLVEVDS